MKSLTGVLLCFSLIFFYSSCKKEEKIDHQNLVIPGNTPPNYNGISTILVENYVNKMFIDLIGLKPSADTKDSLVTFLEENGLKEASRELVIIDILALDAYKDRLFQVNSDLLLNGMGYKDIEDVYRDNEFVRDFLYQSGDTFGGQFFDNELNKLQLVLDAPQDYRADNISLNDYFRRMSYNLIYDEINMGSENFVKACFENYFKRGATLDEVTRGVAMVDGQPSNILLESGRNKVDFLNITTENIEFYQGRVVDAYKTLLLREATSDEVSELTNVYISSGDYKRVQIDIVKTDEYAGFE